MIMLRTLTLCVLALLLLTVSPAQAGQPGKPMGMQGGFKPMPMNGFKPMSMPRGPGFKPLPMNGGFKPMGMPFNKAGKF
jgi:hypothetical protein